MRVLLDESIPRKFGFMLTDHHVRTVQQMGWSGLVNGELLRVAATEFDALISGDKNVRYQQNAVYLPMSVIVQVAFNNKLESFIPPAPRLLELLQTLDANRFYSIGD